MAKEIKEGIHYDKQGKRRCDRIRSRAASSPGNVTVGIPSDDYLLEFFGTWYLDPDYVLDVTTSGAWQLWCTLFYSLGNADCKVCGLQPGDSVQECVKAKLEGAIKCCQSAACQWQLADESVQALLADLDDSK